jgi:hypothetical protein
VFALLHQAGTKPAMKQPAAAPAQLNGQEHKKHKKDKKEKKDKKGEKDKKEKKEKKGKKEKKSSEVRHLITASNILMQQSLIFIALCGQFRC